LAPKAASSGAPALYAMVKTPSPRETATSSAPRTLASDLINAVAATPSTRGDWISSRCWKRNSSVATPAAAAVRSVSAVSTQREVYTLVDAAR
jgi:hypothetical protein